MSFCRGEVTTLDCIFFRLNILFLIEGTHFSFFWFARRFVINDVAVELAGLRVATPLTVKKGGTIFNSDGGKNEAQVWSKTAAWCAYGGEIDRQRAQDALAHGVAEAARMLPGFQRGAAAGNGGDAVHQGGVQRLRAPAKTQAQRATAADGHRLARAGRALLGAFFLE